MSVEPFFEDLSIQEDEDDSSIFYAIPTIALTQDKGETSVSICFLWFCLGLCFFEEELI